MTTATRSELPCSRCHARQVVRAPDGFHDCISCGTTNRPGVRRPAGRSCLACGATIFWVKTLDGQWTPQNGDGTSHWGTCTNPERFKKYKQAHRRKAEGATQLSLETT
jgi:hypothetical protein